MIMYYYTKQLIDKNPFIIYSYLDLFQEYNIPYIYKEWYHLLQIMIKKGKTIQEIKQEIFKKYKAKMSLIGFKQFKFEDSQQLNKKDRQFYQKEQQQYNRQNK